MNYKLAIFDFDGTLANTFPFFVENFNTLAEKYKFRKIDHFETESLRGESARNLIRHIGLPMWKVPFVGAHFRKLMAAGIHRIQPFDDVESMLSSLHQRGIKLSLVTSNSHENVTRVLGAEVTSLFRHSAFNTSMFGKRSALRRVLRHNGVTHIMTPSISAMSCAIWKQRRQNTLPSALSPGATRRCRHWKNTIPLSRSGTCKASAITCWAVAEIRS